MRTARKPSIVWLVVPFLLCSAAIAEDAAVIIRPRDIVAANARNSIVTVVLDGAKSKDVIKRGKQATIKFSVPNYVKGTSVFVCEIGRSAKAATLSFKFRNDSAAIDFAEQLMDAREKALSDCNCH